ncbi:unnamed protein product [Polarella glacialis]|uniref:Anaphase-promoting complex subunit 5 n=1 Tax=Polarella glacialis TaxID=89957 RepID=A0A813L8G8_POLGL|nr:unnamed protein product [Polarella glacialis]
MDIWQELGNVKGEATALSTAVKALCQRGLREDLGFIDTRLVLYADARVAFHQQTAHPNCELCRGVKFALELLSIPTWLRSEDDRPIAAVHEHMCLCVFSLDLHSFDWLAAGVDAMFDCGAAGEALALAEQSLAIIRELGDMCEEAWMLQKLAEVRLARGELTEALLAAQEALALFQAAGDKQGQAAALEALTHVYTAKHEVDKAPNRLQGLSLLSDVAGAVARRDMQGFQEALEQLRRTQGVDDRDLDASLGRLLLQESQRFETAEHSAGIPLSLEDWASLSSRLCVRFVST